MADIQIVRVNAADVAVRWKKNYCNNGKWRKVISGSSKEIYEGILAAGEDLDKIDTAIGNNSWTRLSCNSCGEGHLELVEMLEPDYETTPHFCRNCIFTAAALFEESAPMTTQSSNPTEEK